MPCENGLNCRVRPKAEKATVVHHSNVKIRERNIYQNKAICQEVNWWMDQKCRPKCLHACANTWFTKQKGTYQNNFIIHGKHIIGPVCKGTSRTQTVKPKQANSITKTSYPPQDHQLLLSNWQADACKPRYPTARKPSKMGTQLNRSGQAITSPERRTCGKTQSIKRFNRQWCTQVSVFVESMVSCKWSHWHIVRRKVWQDCKYRSSSVPRD